MSSDTGQCSKPDRFNIRLLIGAIFSALLVFTLFALSSFNNQFVALDDIEYIVANQHVAQISWNNILYAFTGVTNSNWHPLTILTWMFDRHFWGLNPTGYILINCALHAATVFILCLLFNRLFHSFYLNGKQATDDHPSELSILLTALAAALFFGLHPLRVESVVWASQRKDVLCLFFYSLTLYFYLRSGTEIIPTRAKRFRTVVFFCTALALLSKPTALSLPFILLLLDWYPLARITDRQSLYRYIVEKTPIILLTCAVCILTIYAQQESTVKLLNLPFLPRILVACKEILFYPAKTIWPSGLAAIYYHPGNVAHSDLVEYLCYGFLVAVISAVSLCNIKKTRLWASLWFFYLATLAPTLGLIQLGKQWAADRYSYIPALALSLLWGITMTWLYNRLRLRIQGAMAICILLILCQLSALAFFASRQTAYWQNTGTLTTRIIDRMPHQSSDPYYYRALFRAHEGNYTPALNDLNEAIRLSFRNAQSNNLQQMFTDKAGLLLKLGRYQEAQEAFMLANQVSSR